MAVFDDEKRQYAARCAEAPDGWPFDADRDDPLTALRIPAASSHPDWPYIVAFDRASEARPTDAEAAMLASYLAAYKARNYQGGAYQAFLETRPFDFDPGANGLVFHKYGVDDWGFRRRRHYGGPPFMPLHPNVRAMYGDSELERATYTLEQAMDRTLYLGGGPDEPTSPWWTAWKAAHPEAFGGRVPAA